MAITWGDIGAMVAVLVFGSFMAAFIETWWEQRKWDKNKRG
ncbi:unnamed protein product [marine sediment metagenome]|uniref:Uncharacterized protein n=1 Tax=marine sediment metagenome TaxID=412755 RepID=X1TJY0_9ZZZZ